MGYSLIIGSYPFYILLKLFATIYERLLKAKSLVELQIKLENGDESLIGEKFDMFTGIVLLTLN